MEQNLSLYHIFYTVAEYGNISKAATQLYISQPAISKAIKKLEENLGVTLFHRNSRGVILTDEGQLIYQQAAIAFEALEKGEEDLKKVQQLGIGHLRIGVSTTLCKYLLLSYLKEFIDCNPHIKITIQCQSTFDTVSLLDKNKIDIGLIGHPDHIRHLEFYPLTTIQDTFVATNTYLENLKLQNGVDTIDIFKTGTIMLLNEENITRRYIEAYFEKHNIQISQILEVSNMDLLIEFAKIGIGAACVIKEFVQKELENGQLVELSPPALIKEREVGFAHVKNSLISNAMRKFIDFYKNRN